MDELDKTIYNGNLNKNELYCKDLQEYKYCCTTECCNEHLFWLNSHDKQKNDRVEIAKMLLSQE